MSKAKAKPSKEKPPKAEKEAGGGLKPLSRKHQIVLDEYLTHFSQFKAYWKAYPDVSYDSAKSAAARLFADVNFNGHLQLRLAEFHMSADEALKRISEMARADIGDFAEPTKEGGWAFNMEAAKKAGFTKLIKRVKQKTIQFPIAGRVEVELDIELHDSQAALDKIMRFYGKYKDDPLSKLLENYDLSQLTDEQFARLVSGEPLAHIIFGDANKSRGGAPQTPEDG